MTHSGVREPGPFGASSAQTLAAGVAGPVPVSYGFHPDFGIPGLARAEWRLTGTVMSRLVRDGRDLDDGFASPGGRGSFVLGGQGLRLGEPGGSFRATFRIRIEEPS